MVKKDNSKTEESEELENLEEQRKAAIRRLLDATFSRYDYPSRFTTKDDTIKNLSYSKKDVESPITIIYGKQGVGKQRLYQQSVLYRNQSIMPDDVFLQPFECKSDLFLDPKCSIKDLLPLLMEDYVELLQEHPDYKDVFKGITRCVPELVFNDISSLISNPNYNILMNNIIQDIKESEVSFTFIMDESEFNVARNNKKLIKSSTVYKIDEPDTENMNNLLLDSVEFYEATYGVKVPTKIIKYAEQKSDRYIKNIAKPGRIEKLLSASIAISLKRNAKELTKNDINNGLSVLTNIDINSITEPIKTLDKLLSKQVIGQDEAVKKVTKGLQRGLIGLTKDTKPLLTVLSFGTTGIGKTLLAEAVAEILNGSKNILRIDMNTLKSPELGAATLIGVPVGYRGYESGGILTEYVIKHPNAVILLDEIEKANPEIMEIVMQIFDTAHLITPKGDDVDFSNTSIFCTTNAGIKKSEPKVGFASYLDKENNIDLLSNSFKPEILNRFDEVIKLNELSKDDLKLIAKMAIDSSIKTAKLNGLNPKLTEDQKDAIIKKASEESTNGRQANKTATKLSDEIIIESYL